MKYERGWTGSEDTDVDAFDLNKKLENIMLEKGPTTSDTVEETVAVKLDQVEKFYVSISSLH